MRSRVLWTLITGLLALTGCSASPDVMPPTQVDIFVLDLSTSNDKKSQLKRLNEDLNKSLTSKSLGVPKPISNEKKSGPVTTIFTFIEEAATKAETFKIQDAESTIKLWNNEFAKDKERNAKGWLQISSAYSTYLQRRLSGVGTFSNSECQRDLDSNLMAKFRADLKRGRIVDSLCEKIRNLVNGYSDMQLYVGNKQFLQTDIFGMLSKIDRLVEQLKKQDPESIITVNIGSDMQHETGDSRDTPAKLRAINFERDKACNAGKVDRTKEGLTFDQSSILKVNGIGNARISAEFGTALVRYWECFFPFAEIR